MLNIETGFRDIIVPSSRGRNNSLEMTQGMGGIIFTKIE
jgi:hypothetical protein